MGKLLTFIFLIVTVSVVHADRRASAQPKVTRYDLDYHFDFARKLFCTASISITPGDTLNLLLYRLLKVRSVRDNDKQNIPFSQHVTSFSDWEQLQVNAIRIPTRNVTQLRIEYDGYLEGYVETGMLYTKDHIDPRFTFLRPDCFAYPVPGTTTWEDDIKSELTWFDYKVSVTVPDTLTAVNGGQLVSKKTENNQTTYIYTNIKRALRIDIAVAVAKYKTCRCRKSISKSKKQFDKDPKAATTPIAGYGPNRLTDLSYSKGMLFFYILYKKTGEGKFMKLIADHFKKHKSGATLKEFTGSMGPHKALIDDWIWTTKSSEKITSCENVACLVKL